ncbi:MAG: YigZ family protein [Clostridia bacterium]|nr:YigZ family protein [Clostridia bacterium]
MYLYTTVESNSEYSFVEKRSEFIGHCAPVSDELSATDFVESIRKKYSDARHNVYAYNLREGNISRYSDDGEPHGTAGVPVLDVIRKAGVTDCCIVVTRYFGGVLLGTGGLLRAYTAAAAGALESAGVAKVGLYNVYSCVMSYTDYQKLMPLIASLGAEIAESEFSESVRLCVPVLADAGERFVLAVTDCTNGRVKPTKTGEKRDFIRKL